MAEKRSILGAMYDSLVGVAGDKFPAMDPVDLLKQQHRAPALAGDAGAHQARSACSEHNDVIEVQGRIAQRRIAVPRVLI